MLPVAANRELWRLLRDGVAVEARQPDGSFKPERVWVIDWTDADAAALFATLAAELAVEGAALDIETRGTSSRVVAAERAEDVEAWRERFDEAVP